MTGIGPNQFDGLNDLLLLVLALDLRLVLGGIQAVVLTCSGGLRFLGLGVHACISPNELEALQGLLLRVPRRVPWLNYRLSLLVL